MSDRIPISVWLKEGAPRLFFCMYCRENMHIKLEGNVKTMIVGIDASEIKDNYRPLKFPIRIRCNGRNQKYGNCKLEYVIQGFVDE